MPAESATIADIADRLARVSDIYAARNGIDRNDDWFALKLQEEAGELIAEHLRLTGRGRVGGRTEAASARRVTTRRQTCWRW